MNNFGLSYLEAVEQDLLPGESIFWGMGERDNVQTTATGEDVWRGNQLSDTPAPLVSHTSIPAPAESGEQLSVISESPADTVAGLGAQEVTIPYLDDAGVEQTTTVTRNGTTAVPLTPSNVRYPQTMWSSAVGANGVAVGHIRLFKTADASRVYNMIEAGGNMSLVPHRMVPAGYTLFLKEFIPTEATSGKRCRVRMRSDCTNPHRGLSVRQAGVYLFKSLAAINSSGLPMKAFGAMPEFCIIKPTAWAKSGNAEVGVVWWGVLKPTRNP